MKNCLLLLMYLIVKINARILKCSLTLTLNEWRFNLSFS
jgi:hypothetical protein